jgi:hypothetical protein
MAPSFFLASQHCTFDAFHRGDDVTQATSTTWVADVAGATLGRDVRPNPIDHGASTVFHQFGANISFGFAEAVAQETVASRFLVPHGNPEILPLEAIASVPEVHRRTRWIAAESIVGLLDASESDLSEQCLDCLQLNRGTTLVTHGTMSCAGFRRG